jgi:glycosyltransferase domain-containing protein
MRVNKALFENAHLSENLTVLIFTKNRPKSLGRTVQYWRENSFPPIVIDGSQQPHEKLAKGSESTYIHAAIPFNARASIAIEFLTKRFAVVVPDDELLLVSGLNEIVRQLSNNPDLASAGGSTLAIWKYGPRICGYWPYARSTNLQIYGERLSTRVDCLFDSAGSPKVEHMFYNVMQSKVLRDMLNLISSSKVQINEIASIYANLLNGNVAYFPILYWIRNWNELPRPTSDQDRNFILKDFLNNYESVEQRNIVEQFEQLWELRTSHKDFDKKEFDIQFQRLLDIEKKSNSRKRISDFELRCHNSTTLRTGKYLLKCAIPTMRQPENYTATLKVMKAKGITLDPIETKDAITLVSRLWNS